MVSKRRSCGDLHERHPFGLFTCLSTLPAPFWSCGLEKPFVGIQTAVFRSCSVFRKIVLSPTDLESNRPRCQSRSNVCVNCVSVALGAPRRDAAPNPLTQCKLALILGRWLSNVHDSLRYFDPALRRGPYLVAHKNSKHEPPQKLDLVKMVFRAVLPGLRPPPSHAKIASKPSTPSQEIAKERTLQSLSFRGDAAKTCAASVYIIVTACSHEENFQHVRHVFECGTQSLFLSRCKQDCQLKNISSGQWQG